MHAQRISTQLLKKLAGIDQGGEEVGFRHVAWNYARGLYRYHLPGRFLNFFEIRLKTTLGIWEPAAGIRIRGVHHDFCAYTKRSATNAEVVNIPLGNGVESYRLMKRLRSKKKFEAYCGALREAPMNPWLRTHCVCVKHIRGDGGYTSEQVEGESIGEMIDKVLRGELPSRQLCNEVIEALEELTQNLKGYHAQHGKLVGNWDCYNLIYSPKRRHLVNIDAYGLFAWNEDDEEKMLNMATAGMADSIQFFEIAGNPSAENVRIIDSLRILNEARRGEAGYSGKTFGGPFLAGYHSLELDGKRFRGQRDCSQRIAQVPFDFGGKTVVDLGCNCGGMLLALSKTIKAGWGFEINPKCVNAANALKRLNRSSNLEFYTFDLDRNDPAVLNSLLLGESVDMIFMLSLCLWVRRWREIVKMTSAISKNLLFESHGTESDQEEQVAFVRGHYREVKLLSDNSADDFRYRTRKLYLCSHE